jgi:hypothetical protein
MRASQHILDVSSPAVYIKNFNKLHNKHVDEEELRETNQNVLTAINKNLIPNNLQIAIALTILGLTFENEDPTKQAHIIPGGQGKSRIAAMIALIALSANLYDNVHLVYSTERLMKKDKKEFKNVLEITDNTEKVHYHIDIEFEVGKNDLLIFDEGDEYIYENTDKTLKFMKNHACVMLTATINGGREEKVEEKVLKSFGFECYSHMHQPTLGQDIVYQELDLANKNAIATYLEEKKNHQAMLVYGDPELKSFLKENLKVEDVDEAIDDESLKTLHQKDEEGKYRTLVSSNKKQSMRGVDFRAETNGIHLLLCTSFSNKRELIQAAMRVGRQGDSCQRFKLKGLELVDEEAENLYLQKLWIFLKA